MTDYCVTISGCYAGHLNTAKQDKDSWTFASPVNTRYPLMLKLGGLLSQLTLGHQDYEGTTLLYCLLVN